MHILLISTYELGRQPFGLASPAAWLREAGFAVTCADVAKAELPPDAARDADLVAFYLPMHTATRLALPLVDRMRAENPRAHLCCFGLYAPPNETLLRSKGVQTILGGEFEADLVALARQLAAGNRVDGTADPRRAAMEIPRLRFRVPDRAGLPSLDRYAMLALGHERRVVGYTEASRGCKHRCRHCPVVPIYDGHFRVVAREVVLADIRSQVAAGAQHITFGDADFLNGPRHARGIVEALAQEFPGLSYDVTIKISHLLEHADLLPVLRDTGCLFVTSAVESIDDHILALLEKGHSRADFERVVARCRDAGLTLSPTFVPFTPWTQLEGYCHLLQVLADLDLVEQVAPIQLGIRLLVPQGSRLLELPELRRRLRPFDPASLAYPWVHPEPAVDRLHRELIGIVGRRVTATRREVFEHIWEVAHAYAGLVRRPPDSPRAARASVPYLTEPWYC